MTEAVALGTGDQQAAVDRRPQRPIEVGPVRPDDASEQLMADPATRHRHGPQDGSRIRVESVEMDQQEVGEIGREHQLTPPR